MKQSVNDQIRAEAPLLWHFRYRIFSLFDGGLDCDLDTFRSTTPQEIADRQAKRFVNCLTVTDPFCGIGGNTLAFARAGIQVLASDINPERVVMAKHNANLYGVSRRISFSAVDARCLIQSAQTDGLFLDPPWGKNYHSKSTFHLKDFEPDVELLLKTALDRFHVVALKIPRRFELSQLTPFRPTDIATEYIDELLFFRTAYFVRPR